ncbi:uncharacterized protein VTP21DRAFT_383 [Calcarisporiella thermophila]|uniref:uncharacterized protein n=1 Tax=Calcarisporiella thermophila TaxID=911321 RepID=UPI00374230EE
MEFKDAYALLIGTGTDERGKVQQSYESTINDAELLYNTLTNKSRCAYPENQVKLLTGDKATRKNILGALKELSRCTNEQSTVLFFFSGHGVTHDNSHVYLVPAGLRADEELEENAISGDDLFYRINDIPARKRILLLNCCFAGGVVPELLALGGKKEEPLGLSQAVLSDEQIKKLGSGEGIAVLSSSRANERSWTGYRGREVGSAVKRYSAFTMGLVAALSGWGQEKNQEGYVYIHDWAEACRKYVEEKTGRKQHPYFDYRFLSKFPVGYYNGGHTEKSLEYIKDADEFKVDEKQISQAPAPPPVTVSQVSNNYGSITASNGGYVNTGNFNSQGGIHYFGGQHHIGQHPPN